MSNRFLSLLTSIVLVSLVVLALIFVPLESSSQFGSVGDTSQLAHAFASEGSIKSTASDSYGAISISSVVLNSDTHIERVAEIDIGNAETVAELVQDRVPEVITCLPQ